MCEDPAVKGVDFSLNIEDKLNELNKIEKKKKWEDASKAAVELAEVYIDQKNYIESLKYFERAITAQQKVKKTEKVIVLYRKIISAARKGKNKTKKELFRYAAAAIPLIEEYIRVLNESNRYISKHGAMTRYFLGECREIVSGIVQRNEEFLRAGEIFIEIGKKLTNTKKAVGEADEAFERARTIYNLMNNKEAIFEAFLVEADLNIRKLRFERGFLLFDDARGIFDDETHQENVLNKEKEVYAEIGLEILQDRFSDIEKKQIAMMLISKSREAHLLAKSLDEMSDILFEVGRINIKNKQVEEGFSFFDEAINNSLSFGDEAIRKKIIEYLFQEGKNQVDTLLLPFKGEFDNLPFLVYFDKMEDICRKLNYGQEVEELALYIWQLGLQLFEQRNIPDDFPFIEKAITYLINNNRFSGVHKIGEVLEKSLEIFAERKEIAKLQFFKSFLVDCYIRIDDNQSAGLLNVKMAQTYASWGNYEKQVDSLREAASLFQTSDHETIKTFSETLKEQLSRLELYVPYSIFNEVLHLLGNTYLQLGDNDEYDSLFASNAMKFLESNDFDKAMELHQQDFDFLVRIKKIPRALARLEKFSTVLFSKGKYELAKKLRSKQIKLLIDTQSSQESVLQTIKSLEDQIIEALSQKTDISLVKDLFSFILDLYDYLGLKDAHGDAMFELAIRLFEFEYFAPGFEFLQDAYEKFKAENAVEKYGLLMDFAFEKKNFFQDLADEETADLFLSFLITILKELGQTNEAAELIMTRAVQFISTDEDKACKYFDQAKELITQTGSSDELFKFYQDYGTALLKVGKIEEGMQTLAKAEGSTSTNSLAIADTCLTVAKDRFTEKDYDTYFVLVDRALSIYTDLEMFQESSSIALGEARKLWSVNNLPYTMIYLERAWAPLAVTYDEKLEQSIQPVLQASDDFVKALFQQKKYDEAKNFLEFQERIYRQLNLTEKILEVENRKIDALIGRGNIDGALSQVLDMTALGIEESKFKETVAFVKDLLPAFITSSPLKSKDLLKIYVNMLLTMEPKEIAQKILYETLDALILLIIESKKKKQQELFQNQVVLFFNALTEVAEAENVLCYFIVLFTQELTKVKEYSSLFETLEENLSNLQVIDSNTKMKIVNEISSILEYHELPKQTILKGLNFLNDLTQNIDSQNREMVSRIFYMIGMKHKSHKEIYESAVQLALEQSKMTANIPATLDLLHKMIEEDLKTENYLNALERLDEVIEKLDEAPTGLAKDYSELLEEYLAILEKQKKKKWKDLLSTKSQIIREKYIE